METNVEALKDNQKKLTVTIDAAEVDARIKKTYKDFASKYNFPGFRKGKAPRPVIDSMLGAQAVVATVTEDVINELYPVAMDEADLIAISQPTFEQSSELVEAGKDFSFSATVTVRPEFELSSYEPLTIKLPSVEASEEEIDAQIEELRTYYFTFEDASDDTAVAQGAFVELSVVAVDEQGNHVESIETESRIYELGGGLFPKGFDEALIGMKKGEEKTIEIDMSEPSFMGQGLKDVGVVTFTLGVKQVKDKVVPELTDEWARETAGFEGGIEELRQRVADSIKQQKEQMLPRLRETEALYALQGRLEGEAPASMCEVEEQGLLQNFFMQIQQQGMTFDAYLAQMGITSEQFRDDLKRQAKDVTEQDLALDAWARHVDLVITDEEITEEFHKTGVDDPAGLEKEWRKSGRIAGLRAGMRRTAVLNQIMEAMTVEDLKPGEKLLSAVEESETAEQAESQEEPKAETSEKLTKTELNKLKVAELRELAQKAGIETDGLKKAELVEALLAAE